LEITVLVAVAVIAVVLAVVVTYCVARLRFEGRFRQWREAETLRWQEEAARAAKAAVTQSRAVLGGKFTEQMAPYLPDFRYDPTEARFIGTPIDLVVFPGLATGDPQEIVIMEIKSGKSPQLTPQQRKIRQLIEDGMVRWELIHLPPQPEAAG